MKLFYKTPSGNIDTLDITNQTRYGETLGDWEEKFCRIHRDRGFIMTKIIDRRGKVVVLDQESI